MKLTVEDILRRLDKIRNIVDRIEYSDCSIDAHKLDIAELLDEYAMILRERKVDI